MNLLGHMPAILVQYVQGGKRIREVLERGQYPVCVTATGSTPFLAPGSSHAPFLTLPAYDWLALAS